MKLNYSCIFIIYHVAIALFSQLVAVLFLTLHVAVIGNVKTKVNVVVVLHNWYIHCCNLFLFYVLYPGMIGAN